MNTTGTAAENPPIPKSHAYSAALAFLGCLIPLPIVAIVVTAAIYIAPFSPALGAIIPAWIAPNWMICLVGFVITLVLWLLFALPFIAFSSMESAIPIKGSDLKNRFLAVRACYNALLALEKSGDPIPKERVYSYQIASEQVKCYLAELEQLIRYKDLRWIAGTGYLAAWNLVHRAEEALIMLEPREDVIREALNDELSLEGSDMETGDIALNKLRRAVANLSASATMYLDQQPVKVIGQNVDATGGASPAQGTGPVNHTPHGTPVTTVDSSPATNGTPAGTKPDTIPALTDGTPQVKAGDLAAPATGETPMALAVEPSSAAAHETPVPKDGRPVTSSGRQVIDVTTELEARSALREVRRTINEFRKGLWEGLVTIRNQLIGTTIFTALPAYIILLIAIIAGAPQASIMAATIFYTVGALTGLFGRLYIESKTDSATDDYDLTLARIVVTPVLAGLAAVGGVLLTTMLSLTVLKSPALQTSTSQLGLGAIYNLNSNAFGIIVAAVFGLTPNLFINILQDKAKGLTDQLQKSTASELGKSRS